MKFDRTKQTALYVAVIIGGFAMIFFLSGYLEKTRPALPENYADEDLALQGARLKGYSLGFEGLLADWYWMKSLQYVGDKILKSREQTNIDDLGKLNPRLLYPYLDNASTLDPRFLSVYEYGAVVLPAINEEQAVKIAEKGIANNPNEWRLYHQLGYIYWRLKNYEKAAEVYEKGSNVPNAPPLMKLMTANMKNRGGSRETARLIYRQMLDEARDAQIKENAALRLLQLDSFDERDAIQKILDDFKAKNNRCPSEFREILPVLRAVKLPDGKNLRVDKAGNPLDPTATPYVLNSENCSVDLDPKSKVPQN